MRQTALILSSLALVSAATTAQIDLYGPACDGVFPEPQISMTGSTTPKRNATLHLTGAPPNGTVVLIVGTNKDELFPGVPLPYDLSGEPGVNAGCFLLNNATLQFLLSADSLGEVHFGFKQPKGLGEDIYFQYAVLEQDSPLSVTMTEGLHVHLTNVVTATPSPADLLTVPVGSSSVPRTIVLSNDTDKPLTVSDLVVFDSAAADYSAVFVDTPPILLQPTDTTNVEVTFSPSLMGERNASLKVVHDNLPPNFNDLVVPLVGVGLGPTAAELLIDSGGSGLVDSQGQFWAADFGVPGGLPFSTTDRISGTLDQDLYKSWRAGPSFTYSIDVPNDEYEVTFHFSENDGFLPGERTFDVTAEGLLVEDDLDVAQVAGANAAYQVSHLVTVADGVINLGFVGVVDLAMVGAIEIRSYTGVLDAAPRSIDYGTVAQGSPTGQAITLDNTGTADLTISQISMLVNNGAGHDFELDIGGTLYTGGETSVTLPANHFIASGGSQAATLTFDPTEHENNDVTLRFEGDFDTIDIPVMGNGGSQGSAFLHVVIEPIPLTVDYDEDGQEDVALDGTFSHTHEPGQTIVDTTWKEGIEVLGTTPIIFERLGVGPHTITLEIGDDKIPQETLADNTSFEIYTPQAIPGVVANYYKAPQGTAVEDLLDAVPASIDFAERRATLSVVDEGGIGGSGFSEKVMVQLIGQVDIAVEDDYDLVASGGTDTRLFVNASPAVNPVHLTVGSHTVEARFSVLSINDLPLDVLMAVTGNTPVPIDPADLTYDATGIAPVINDMPTEGITLGGNLITIDGFGFFPEDQVIVHWDTTDLDEQDFTSYSDTQIEFFSPPHAEGVISVTVETPAGTSNARSFTYGVATTPPIAFDMTTPVTSGVNGCTSGAWGPDGRFYVARRAGKIVAITFDEDYVATDVTSYDGVDNLSNDEILGIAFNPFDPPSPVKIYVAHSELYAWGGGSFVGPAPYLSEISVLTGPNFDNPTVIVDNLPVSNHDHGVNGMQFDNNGDLLLCVGGNTNAGVKFPNIGDLPESPLSAAILKVLTSKPGFNGDIRYHERIGGAENMDQVFGEDVVVAPGVDVFVHAAGLRNSYDLAYTTSRRLYATDNGPNNGFGLASTGPATADPDPAAPDKVLLVEYDNYYGHPNRARGPDNARQYIYRDIDDPAIPGEYVDELLEVSSSSNGIAEYRATAFQGQMRGNLLVQRWNGVIKRLEMSADGRSVDDSSDLANLSSLDVSVGPGGAILGVDYSSNDINVLTPNDVSATSMVAWDIFPWRATASSGQTFVIGGANFGNLGNTSVTIGGLAATVTSVTDKRITGTLPIQPSPTTDLLDVVVDSDSQVSNIPGAFRYLFDTPGNEPGWWETGTDLALSMSDVAAGVIDGVIHVVGVGGANTKTFDIASQTWGNAAPRTFFGSHHAVEVVGGKLYVLGGTGGSAGEVQIYDPVGDSWSSGAVMPWAGTSVNTAVIDGKIYAAGGYVAGVEVTNCAEYDPVGDSWTPKAAMPLGRHHAAAGTDGSKLWIFGGRDGGDAVTNGYDDVQVYDPTTDTWDWDKSGSSTLAPLPQARSGMGRAIWYQNEFTVMGGETFDGPGATVDDVYDLVDAYDPATDTWRAEAPMITARHGFAAVLYQSRMFIVSGSDMSGTNGTDILEIFTRQ